MRILFINVVCGIRSTGRICTDLATTLEAEGHEVKIAYGRENVPQQYEKYAVRIGSKIDVQLHGLKARLCDGCGFGSRKATKKFIEWVKEYNPDIIHLHNIHGYYINVEVLFDYLRYCGKKIIWTLHDCWAFTGHTAYCDSINCLKWIQGCDSCPLLNEYPKSYIDRSLINWQKKRELFTGIPNLVIVTPSQWLKNMVADSYLSSYYTIVVNNGIDTSIFRPFFSKKTQKYSFDDKFVVLGVASSWDDMKGLSDYVRLSSMLDKRFLVVLVGLTEKQIKLLPSTIMGIKRTTSLRELADLYNSADIFLNLTYCDTYPTVNLEAVACGLRIVTYKTGGSSEIAEKYNGIIVEKGDLDSVVNVLNNIDFKYAYTVEDYSQIDLKYAIQKYIKIYEKM